MSLYPLLGIFGVYLFAQNYKNKVFTPILNLPKKVMYFEQTVCFGTCPIYKVTLWENGDADYEGIDFVKTKGRHRVKFPMSFMNKIKNFDTRGLKDVYDDNITDVPSTIIELGDKRIVARWNYPKRTEELIKYVKGEMIKRSLV